MECHLQEIHVFSNSGIVVSAKEDLTPYEKHGELKGLYYQMALEKSMCKITPEYDCSNSKNG